MPPYRNRKKSGYTKRPASVAKTVKKVLDKQAETLMYEKEQDEVTISDLTDVNKLHCLNTVTIGDGPAERSGKKVRGKGVMLRFVAHNQENQAQHLRVLLLRTGGLGNNPISLNDVFRGVGGSTQNWTGRPLDMVFGIDYSKHQVLFDKVMTLGPNDSNEGSQTKYIKKYVPLRNMNTVWGPSSNIPDKGQIYLAIFNTRADADSTTGARVELSWRSNFTYQDM